MGLVKNILSEEYDRVKKLEKKYKKELASFPGGSISVKKRNGVNYCYLAFREGKKIVFKYLGKESSKTVLELKVKIKKRKKIQDKLKKIKESIKELERAVNGKRT